MSILTCILLLEKNNSTIYDFDTPYKDIYIHIQIYPYSLKTNILAT